MAAGSTHCLALTEDSEVHSWGNNDQCQHFDTLHQTKPEPSLLPGLDTKHIVGIACGPAQVLGVAALGTCGMLVLRCPPWCVETPCGECVPSCVLCWVTLVSSGSFPVGSSGGDRSALSLQCVRHRLFPVSWPGSCRGTIPSPVIYSDMSRPVAECIDPSLVLVSPPQSFAWSSCSEWSVGLRVPFVVDVCSGTFEQLDLLLRQVSEGMDGTADWPPPQEKECMAVATLNLLRLQVGARPSCGRGCLCLLERL